MVPINVDDKPKLFVFVKSRKNKREYFYNTPICDVLEFWEKLSNSQLELFLNDVEICNYIYHHSERLLIIQFLIDRFAFGVFDLLFPIYKVVLEEDIACPNDYFSYCLFNTIEKNKFDPHALLRLKPSQIKYLINGYGSRFISYICNKPNLELFFSQHNFRETIYSFTPGDICCFLEGGGVFYQAYYNDPCFLKIFLDIESPSVFRNIMGLLYDSNYYLYEKLNRMRKNINRHNMQYIVNNNGLLPYIKDRNDNSLTNRISEKRLLEIFIEHFFEDIPWNVLLNIREMVRFINDLDYCPINKSHFDLYTLILEYEYFSPKVKAKIFQLFDNGTDYVTMLYENYNTLKRLATKALKEYISKKSFPKNEELTNRYGVPVYNVEGNFQFLIHATKCDVHNKPTTTSLSLINNSSLTNFSYSCSLCANKRKKVDEIRKEHGYILFGFNDFDHKRIMNMYYTDSYSRELDGTDKIFTLKTPDSFIKCTLGYNEILYKNLISEGKYDVIRPSFILCYDSISTRESQIAAHYRIPIYLVRTNKKQYNKYAIVSDDTDSYITAFEAEKLDNYSLIFSNKSATGL